LEVGQQWDLRFDDMLLGYVPELLWNGACISANCPQVFGEVATRPGVDPNIAATTTSFVCGGPCRSCESGAISRHRKWVCSRPSRKGHRHVRPDDHHAIEARQGRRPSQDGRAVAGFRTAGFRTRAHDDWVDNTSGRHTTEPGIPPLRGARCRTGTRCSTARPLAV